ncbi:MAG: hypothetical protein OXG65_07205 [Chloroflexi bacterium]|nr:hypothetical protein [Chloroflexota bacterium]
MALVGEAVERALEERRRAAALRDEDPVAAAGQLRAAVAGLSVESQPVEFGLANYDLAGVLLEGEASNAILNEAAQAAARALLVFTPQELPDLFAGASERLGQAQWRAGRREAAQRTYAQTAGALGAVGQHGLQARLLAGYARAAGQDAKPNDPFSVRQAVGVFDEAIAAARKADARGLLVSLLNGSGRLLASNPASADEALSRFDQAAEAVNDANVDVGVAMAVHANRAAAYGLRQAGDRDANLQEAIASYNKAVHLPGIAEHAGEAAQLYRALGAAWGQRPGGDRAQNLRQADSALATALELLPDDSPHSERASMWSERGLAQAELSQRGIPGATSAAVEAFREGLKAASNNEATALAAQLANNLGSAIMSAAGQGLEASLAEAAEALDRAAELWTSLGRPEDAGASQLNAGLVYMTLHSTEGDASHLDKAIERLQAASEARPLATHPAPHAVAQFNLGMALAFRAQGRNETDLAASVAAFRAALQVWTGPNAPPQAAVAHANLGSMLFGMAKQNEPDLLREAAYHYEQALAVYTPSTNPQQHQVISSNLALLRRRQGIGSGNGAI